MRQYLELAREIIEHGRDKDGRNGVTRGLFARQLRFNLYEGFPAITTKKLLFKSVKAELLWFIEGGRKTGWRLDENRLREFMGKTDPTAWSIWTEDARSLRWKPRVLFPGDCGRIYGAQWRNWRGPGGAPDYIDQLAVVVDAIRHDPYERQRKIVTARNVGELNDMCLPPCHERFQFFVTPGTDGKPKCLSVHMVQRSCDVFLGVPFNFASYALLLSMVAQVTGLTPLEVVIDFIDVHIYEQHFDQVREQLTREPLPLPTLWLNPEVKDIDSFTVDDIKLVGYQHHEAIKAELAKDKVDR